MAVGDCVADIQTIAAGANYDLQPSVGVVYIMVEAGNQSGNVTKHLYDGTNLYGMGSSLLGRQANLQGGSRPPLEHDVYLRLTNAGGGAEDVALSYYVYV